MKFIEKMSLTIFSTVILVLSLLLCLVLFGWLEISYVYYILQQLISNPIATNTVLVTSIIFNSKNEILISVSDLFNLIFKGVKPIDDTLQNTLANIIMLSYLLGKRLGISFDEIDIKIKEKAKEGIRQESSVETWFGDLSKLEKHIDNRE